MSEESTDLDFKFDGWENELTGLGLVSSDKRMSTNIGDPTILSQGVVENLFDDDYLARKIVALPAQESTRVGITITPTETLTAEKISELNKITDKKLQLWKYIRRGLKWSRLYGGGVVVMIVDDGLDSSEPVNINGIKAIRGLYDLNRYQIEPIGYQVDPTKPGFGEPELYRLNYVPIYGSQQLTIPNRNPSMAKFHRSRLMLFDGIEVPQIIRDRNNGWGNSVLQATYSVLRNYWNSKDGAASLVSDFAQAVFKIKNLHSKVASESNSVVAQRMQIINLARSMIKAVVIDTEGEEFERKTTPVTGLADLLDRMERDLVASSEMPHTILFGDSPSGLGATGNHEMEVWKDWIAAYQESEIRPELDTFYFYVSNASEYKVGGEEIAYEFNSLWQMSDDEKAKIRKTIAEADALNIDRSVYDAVEARTRYEGDEFSIDLSLEPREERQLPEAQIEEEE